MLKKPFFFLLHRILSRFLSFRFLSCQNQNNSHSILNFNVFSCRFIWIEYQTADTIAWILISHVENTFTRCCFVVCFIFFSIRFCTLLFLCIRLRLEEQKFLRFSFNFICLKKTWSSSSSSVQFMGWSLSLTRFSNCLGNKWPQISSIKDDKEPLKAPRSRTNNCFSLPQHMDVMNGVPNVNLKRFPLPAIH